MNIKNIDIMEKKIKLLDPETDKPVAEVTLLTIDWYNELQSAFEDFLDNGGTDIDAFIEYVNSNTSLKIK